MGGLICSEGDHWKEQRRWIGQALRQVGAIGPGLDALLAPTMVELLTELEKAEGPITLGPILGHVVGNMMNQLIFGMRYSSEDTLWQKLQHLRDEGIKMIGVCGIVNFLPIVRHWPSVAKNIRWIKEGQRDTHREYERLVVDREAQLKQGEAAICITDLFLEEAARRRLSGEGESSFTRKQLYHLQADLFGAGTDTSLNTISWSLLLLSSPDQAHLVQALQAELDEECGDEGEIHLGLRLPLLRATILEVMRLRPVVPLGVPHGVVEEVDLTGWRLPKATMVLPLHWAINSVGRTREVSSVPISGLRWGGSSKPVPPFPEWEEEVCGRGTWKSSCLSHPCIRP